MNPKQLREQRRQQGERQTITEKDVAVVNVEDLTNQPRIVEATMTAVGMNRMGGERTRADRIEAAMAAAVEEALLQGVSIANSAEIKKRIMAARQAVLDEEAEILASVAKEAIERAKTDEETKGS